MVRGIILKGIAGFYYVKTDDNLFECKARGKFKNQKLTPLVGDRVLILPENEEKATIEEIEKRKTELLRPAVANVDHSVIVFAVQNPDPNRILLDKMTVLSLSAGVEPIICFNKLDGDQKGAAKLLKETYELAGFRVILSSCKTGEGIEELKAYIQDKITVFAGPSGVGKSSLLNRLQKGLSLKTGEISEKIKRGKHTTRHSELIELEHGGWVVDTPGFTSLELDFLEADALKDFFPEFEGHEDLCRFDDCIHINEPGCGVIAAVDNFKISGQRYESYRYLYQEIKNTRRQYK
jgi:ribosome biogenesis GTPase